MWSGCVILNILINEKKIDHFIWYDINWIWITWLEIEIQYKTSLWIMGKLWMSWKDWNFVLLSIMNEGTLDSILLVEMKVQFDCKYNDSIGKFGELVLLDKLDCRPLD